MEEDEFLSVMSEDFPDLHISKNDLANPTCQFLKRYYVAMLEAITRVSAAKLCQFTEKQLEFLEHFGEGPQFNNHVSNYNLYCILKSIFESFGNIKSEFHYSDLLFPMLTRKRSFVFMSMMHLLYASCVPYDMVIEKMITVSEKKNLIDNLKGEIQHLKQQLADKENSKINYFERAKIIRQKLSEYSSLSVDSQVLLKTLQEKENVELAKLMELDEVERVHQEQLRSIENEKKYYESLVVSDENQIIDNHMKMVSAKTECLETIQGLERKVSECSTQAARFDKVLTLQSALVNALKEEYIINTHALGLKDLYLTACALQSETRELGKLEAELLLQIKEKEDAVPTSKIECAKLDSEINSVMCTWKEKLSRYNTFINDLQRAVSELTASDQLQSSIAELQAKLQEIEIEYSLRTNTIKTKMQMFAERFALFDETLVNLLISSKESAQSYTHSAS